MYEASWRIKLPRLGIHKLQGHPKHPKKYVQHILPAQPAVCQKAAHT